MKRKTRWPDGIHEVHVGVDAGMIYIGDPCYVVPEDGQVRWRLDRDGVTDRDVWGKFLSKYVTDENRPIYPVEEGAAGSLGVVVNSGHGDGVYPVTIVVVKGRVVAATITFIGDNEE